MRKLVFAICEQQRHRSACASTLSDQSLISAFVIRCLGSLISLVSIVIISCLYLAYVAEQTGLSYLGANPEDRFSRDVTHMYI